MRLLFSLTILLLLFSACISKTLAFEKINERYLESFTEDQLLELELIDSIGSFKATTIFGKDIQFGKESDKPTLLFFFATWCPACKEAYPEINSSFEDLNQDVHLIAIGRGHTQEELIEWAKGKKVAIDVVADPENELYDRFAKKFIPRVYIIDPDGKVRFQDYGWSDQTVFLSGMALRTILSEKDEK